MCEILKVPVSSDPARRLYPSNALWVTGLIIDSVHLMEKSTQFMKLGVPSGSLVNNFREKHYWEETPRAFGREQNPKMQSS